MIEVFGDMFVLMPKYDAICITTNGFVRQDGACVMGRGCALTAKNKWPDLPYKIGARIKQAGNRVHSFVQNGQYIFTFPVKHNWYEVADPELIRISCRQLMAHLDEAPNDLKNVLLPRPGCGNGHLNWSDVKLILEEELDDRVSVVTFRPTD